MRNLCLPYTALLTHLHRIHTASKGHHDWAFEEEGMGALWSVSGLVT